MIGQALIEADGRWLSLRWRDGVVSRLPAVWLRDNGQDERSRHPGNGQRLFTILDLPADIRIVEAVASEDRLDLAFAPDGHRTSFDTGWLRHHVKAPPRRQPGWLADSVATWGRELTIAAERWADLAIDDGSLARWLAAVERHGVALLTGLPCGDGALLRVVERFGHVRETNYGRWFDVRSEVEPSNLAYTRLGLQVHTDNPYRDPVPGLQLLHCLANSADGGDSVIVDGFAAAQRLRARDEMAFARLAHWPVEFSYSSGDTILAAKAPLLGLGVDGELIEIRFNNRSLGTPHLPESEIEAWYQAYRLLAQELESPELRVAFKLAPGELFIVDNRRVLHGRTGFSGSGKRHLQGCYADRDGLSSTLAVLRRRTHQTENEK